MLVLLKLTEREKEILSKLVEVDRVTTAAASLGITAGTVYNVLYRIRSKQREARKFVNQILSYRKKSKLLRQVLASRLTMEELEKLSKEVEPE